MRLFSSITLAAALAFCAAATPAQAVRRHGDPPASQSRGSAREQAAEPQAAGASQDDKVYTPLEVTRKAHITRKPLPSYTREARRKLVRGTVSLRLILRSDGRVDDHIEVRTSLPEGLTEEAIRVAKLIEFEPAERDGHKVSQYVIVEYGFNIY